METETVSSQAVINHEEFLRENVFGSHVSEIFDDGLLPGVHSFSWESVAADPKGNHGEIEISRFDRNGQVAFFKDMKYELLHTGGFLRLCSLRGRVYWNAQNEGGHVTQDWKIHFSVHLNDVPKAWNILAALFMEMRCDIGMKATYLGEEEWSEGQRGREITVYAFCSHRDYKGYMEEATSDALPYHVIYLGKEMEIYSTAFWFTFVVEAEARLLRFGIRSRGCADGDFALPHCRFASIRNEAFVRVNGQLCYPPNDAGWNAARHPNPFLELIFFLQRRTMKLQ